MRPFFILFCLCGCGIVEDGFGGQTAYLGSAQEVDLPYYSADKFIINRQIEIAGAWLDLKADGDPIGLGLGYRDLNITAAPLECTLVIFVSSDDQLESVRALTKEFYKEGESPCIVR